MARIPLLTERDGLDERQAKVFDAIVESRGSMIRPYEVLLYAPGMAGPTAELGHQIRYEGTLSDSHREIAIITTATVCACQFEWDSHIELAKKAGVSVGAISHLQGGPGEPDAAESLIIEFVRELSTDRTVSDETFRTAEDALGTEGVIELATLIGYYTLLGYTMNVAGAC